MSVVFRGHTCCSDESGRGVEVHVEEHERDTPDREQPVVHQYVQNLLKCDDGEEIEDLNVVTLFKGLNELAFIKVFLHIFDRPVFEELGLHLLIVLAVFIAVLLALGGLALATWYGSLFSRSAEWAPEAYGQLEDI